MTLTMMLDSSYSTTWNKTSTNIEIHSGNSWNPTDFLSSTYSSEALGAAGTQICSLPFNFPLFPPKKWLATCPVFTALMNFLTLNKQHQRTARIHDIIRTIQEKSKFSRVFMYYRWLNAVFTLSRLSFCSAMHYSADCKAWYCDCMSSIRLSDCNAVQSSCDSSAFLLQAVIRATQCCLNVPPYCLLQCYSLLLLFFGQLSLP